MKFKKYKTTKNEDGSYNILSVPIFKLGKHKGYEFSKKWFEKTKKNLEKQEKDDYYPPLIIGHNDGKTEKPAKGFFKNLSLKGETMAVDLIKIPEKVYNEIKDRAYPYRSIEVEPKKNRITALALLGSSTPYHKLPILEIFSEDKEHEVLSFYIDSNNDLVWDTTIAEQAERDLQLSKLRKIWDIVSNRMWAIFSSDKSIKEISQKVSDVLEEGTSEIKKELKANKKSMKEDKVDSKQFTEEELRNRDEDAKKMYRLQFKEKHGMFPEEFVEKQKMETEKTRVAEVKTFCETLKVRGGNLKLAPAVIDDLIQPFLEGIGKEKVKFGEEEYSHEDAAKEMIKTLLKRAEEKKLFVDMDEKSKHSDNHIKTHFDNRDDVDNEALTYHKKALAMMDKDARLTYGEAIKKVLE